MHLLASSFLLLLLLVTFESILAEYGTPGQMVMHVNIERRELAKKYQIANMQMVVLDDRLMEAAEKEMKKCNPVSSNGPDFQMMTDTEVRHVRIDANALFRTRSIPEGSFLGGNVLFFPTKSQLGVANMKCNGEDHVIGAVGPGTTWKYSDIKWGPPGSRCNSGQTREDGLCIDK